MMSCKCFFCDDKRFSLNKDIGIACEDSIIFEDENVFITPDIAPVIEGHFLIVTKKHLTSFGGADAQTFESLERAKEFIRSSVFTGEKVLFFEHGAVIEKTAGSCIDHAHAHAIPLTKEIDINGFIKDVMAGFITTKKVRATREALKNCANDRQPYLFYEKGIDDAWYYPVDKLPSQFFRMMIAYYYTKAHNWKLSYRSTETKELFERTLALAKENINNQRSETHDTFAI
jgi:diadenosine tetraphosphate (Ap4A) HIT family hydrolase